MGGYMCVLLIMFVGLFGDNNNAHNIAAHYVM